MPVLRPFTFRSPAADPTFLPREQAAPLEASPRGTHSRAFTGSAPGARLGSGCGCSLRTRSALAACAAHATTPAHSGWSARSVERPGWCGNHAGPSARREGASHHPAICRVSGRLENSATRTTAGRGTSEASVERPHTCGAVPAGYARRTSSGCASIQHGLLPGSFPGLLARVFPGHGAVRTDRSAPAVDSSAIGPFGQRRTTGHEPHVGTVTLL